MSFVVQNAIYRGPYVEPLSGSKIASMDITVEETFTCTILSSSSENAVVKRSNGDEISLPLSHLKIVSPKWHAGDAVYITSRCCLLQKGNVLCACVRCLNDIKREVLSVRFSQKGIYEYYVGRFGTVEFIVPEQEILPQTLVEAREKFKKEIAEEETKRTRESEEAVKAFRDGLAALLRRSVPIHL